MQSSEPHKTGGTKIRSIILGLNDGLISTFTLLIGVAAATIAGGNSIVILTGFAAMVSGACSMGLGEYISSKSEYNFTRNEIKKEKAEIELFPDEEKEEVRDIFSKMGFQGKNLDSCVETITSNKQVWLDFLTKSELGLDEPEHPALGALLTFLAFVIGAFVPLFPYFLNLGVSSLIFSSIVSFIMLFLVGALKSKITGEKPLKGAIEMVLVGTIAFIISYSIGLVMEGIVVN
ncbi:MAG: VIT1/CCC1 transporter family protein [Candidatus Lokiarchaeota archaeon]|nr:VIT1/CCC1 transporter family protein [Candidatus Lokiarchaeota archaeon]